MSINSRMRDDRRVFFPILLILSIFFPCDGTYVTITHIVRTVTWHLIVSMQCCKKKYVVVCPDVVYVPWITLSALWMAPISSLYESIKTDFGK